MEKKNGFKEFLCSKGGKIGLIVLLYVIIYLLIGASTTWFDNDYIGLVYGVVLGIFGWKALNRIQPDVFLIMPIIGWVIFFVVKAVLSFIVGIFVAPYVIGKKITESIQNSLK